MSVLVCLYVLRLHLCGQWIGTHKVVTCIQLCVPVVAIETFSHVTKLENEK